MELTRYLVGVEIVVPVLVAVAVSLSRWQAGMRASWKEEAEAQSARAARLEVRVTELSDEVRQLRALNAALQTQLAELLGRPR